LETSRNYIVRFEVLKAVPVNIIVMTSRNLVNVYRGFRGKFCLCLQCGSV
jgi:hypothetical protein